MWVYVIFISYIQDYSVQFPQKLLTLQLLKRLFWEVVFAHSDHRFMKGRPIDFLNQSLDVIEFELGFPVDGLLDLDQKGEVVLVALCHITNK